LILSNRESRLRTICGVLVVANMVMLAVFQALRGGSGYDSVYAQGYHFGRPVNADAFTAWTHTRLGGIPALLP
jgi:EAL domain-containing protein (putative c-di-GMP-specific phosphodiesterase class I)